MASIPIRKAEEDLTALVAKAQAGEEVVLTDDGRPVARLVPVAPSAIRRQFGALRGQARVDARFFEPLPDDEREGWSNVLGYS